MYTDSRDEYVSCDEIERIAYISDQTLDQQPQSYGQSQAAFTQNAMSSQAAPEQQNYNYYTRSNIPASPQQQQQQVNK